jgi:hypothetical protein
VLACFLQARRGLNYEPASRWALAVFSLLSRQHLPKERALCLSPLVGELLAVVVTLSGNLCQLDLGLDLARAFGSADHHQARTNGNVRNVTEADPLNANDAERRSQRGPSGAEFGDDATVETGPVAWD